MSRNVTKITPQVLKNGGEVSTVYQSRLEVKRRRGRKEDQAALFDLCLKRFERLMLVQTTTRFGTDCGTGVEQNIVKQDRTAANTALVTD
jgi:hypothetical protein